MKTTIVVNGHTWERQEPGWWTTSCNTGSYGVCQERDGWYLYGPGTATRQLCFYPRGPYRTMGLAMAQMLPAAVEQK